MKSVAAAAAERRRRKGRIHLNLFHAEMIIRHRSLSSLVVVLPVFLPYGLVVMLINLPLDLPQPEWAVRVLRHLTCGWMREVFFSFLKLFICPLFSLMFH